MSASKKRRLSTSSSDSTEDDVDGSSTPAGVLLSEADDAALLSESQRLKDLAYAEGILRPADRSSASSHCVPPPPGLRLYSNTDVLKKNQARSNPRCLFVFPGRFHLLSSHKQDIKQQQEAVKAVKAEHAAAAMRADSTSSISSASLGPSLTQVGRIGSVAHMDSSNPIIYLDFPQGQMKLLGSIVYLKNSSLLAIEYHHPQSSKKIKTLTCKATFDHLFVFSEYHWIGKKEDNLTEQPLDIPIELAQAQIGISLDDDTLTNSLISETAMTTATEDGGVSDTGIEEEEEDGEDKSIENTTAANSSTTSSSKKKRNKPKSLTNPKKQGRRAARDEDDYDDEDEQDGDIDDVDGDASSSTPVSRPRRASRKEVSYDVDLEASDTEVIAEEEEQQQEDNEEDEEEDEEAEETEAEEEDQAAPPRKAKKTSKQSDDDDDEVVLISDDDD